MSSGKISPKVIDIEGNRVGSDVVKGKEYDKDIRTDHIYGGGQGMITGDFIREDKNGRFPTQLFTNNKNEKFKYIIQI